jgi:acyl-CoA thioester hydrolase
MSRIKIPIPENFSFTATIPVRITDINYGNHVGNDAVLSLIHEARMQFLLHHRFSELNCGGVGLIMADAGIEFKKEIFYGDVVEIKVTASNFSSIGFDLFYLLQKQNSNNIITVAVAKTGMVCYNYELKKVTSVPEIVKEKLSA